MNIVLLKGEIFKPVEVRKTKNEKIVANGVLVTKKNYNGNKTLEYHNLVFWNASCDKAKELKKGNKIFVKGEITTTSWEKDGKKNYMTQINCQDFDRLHDDTQV